MCQENASPKRPAKEPSVRSLRLIGDDLSSNRARYAVLPEQFTGREETRDLLPCREEDFRRFEFWYKSGSGVGAA